MTAPLTDAQAAKPEARKITVRIDSSRPVFIEADADSFGAIFAGLNDDEQVEVLRSMIEHMKPHRMQWDYISIKLEAEENSELATEIADALFPGLRTERDALRAELDAKETERADLWRANRELHSSIDLEKALTKTAEADAARLRKALGSAGAEATKATSSTYAVAVSACQKIRDIALRALTTKGTAE